MSENRGNTLVTFALLSFNQEAFIRDAVEAALSQNYEPMEILISDDCSSDRTFEVASSVVERYRGLHQIRLVKHTKNLGIAGNVNSVFSQARGEYVVLAAGDDISVPGRVSRIMSEASRGDFSLLHSRVTKITLSGDVVGDCVPPLIENGMNDECALLGVAGYIGASGAVRRTLYEKFGPIKYMSAYEDLVFLSRVIISGQQAKYIDESLVKYRVNSGVTAVPDLLNETLKVNVKNRIYTIMAHADVFRQRLADVEIHYLIPKYIGIIDKIRRGKDILVARHCFYCNRVALPQLFLKSPVCTAYGVWQEIRFLAYVFICHILRKFHL